MCIQTECDIMSRFKVGFSSHTKIAQAPSELTLVGTPQVPSNDSAPSQGKDSAWRDNSLRLKLNIHLKL